jgi:hypothetical protein
MAAIGSGNIGHNGPIMMTEDDIEWDLSLHALSAIEGSNGAARGNPSISSELSPGVHLADAAEEEYGKISDAVTYGPRFCEIFREYSATQSKPIDIRRHLMALCCEHLVPFVCWARQNEARLAHIRTTLLEYDYLRPEVRNGIVMVIIYTFASIKATIIEDSDMFRTLQDPDHGLGIANKFSLKIYNDPYFYLIYLKTCISALIDAGAIPDNERIGNPKRNKTVVENQEELDAYEQIKQALVAFLDAGENMSARKMILQITSYWQQRAKVTVDPNSSHV